jgi:hypothetical protein
MQMLLPYIALLARCCLLQLCRDEGASDGSSSSGLPAPGSWTAQQQQQLAALEPLLQPWALVQVQLMQLSGMQRAGMGWDVHCSYALLSIFDIVERRGGAARTAVNGTLLRPVLLELLPHMQDHCNVWGSADTPTASSSSSSSSSGGGG